MNRFHFYSLVLALIVFTHGPSASAGEKEGQSPQTGAGAQPAASEDLPEFVTTRAVLRKHVRRDGTATGELAKAGYKHVTSLSYKIKVLKSDGSTEPVDEANRTFEIGQQFYLEIECDSDLYVYVFHEGNDEKRTMLLPDPSLGEREVVVNQGVQKVLPDDGKTCFEFAPPAGTERLLVFASPEKMPDLTPDEAFKQNPNAKELADIKLKTEAAANEITKRSIGQWKTKKKEQVSQEGKMEVAASRIENVKPKIYKNIKLQSMPKQ